MIEELKTTAFCSRVYVVCQDADGEHVLAAVLEGDEEPNDAVRKAAPLVDGPAIVVSRKRANVLAMLLAELSGAPCERDSEGIMAEDLFVELTVFDCVSGARFRQTVEHCTEEFQQNTKRQWVRDAVTEFRKQKRQWSEVKVEPGRQFPE